MRIVPLNESCEKVFWNHVNQDPSNYYFFIFDWKQRRDQTRILMAIEGENVEGLMLIYRDAIVQLRGNREAVETLLGNLDLDKVELQAPLECEDLVLRKYKPTFRVEMMLMRLLKREEHIQVRHEPERLTVEDAEEIADLMRSAFPEWWGDITTDMQKKMMEDALWLGIKRDDKIVSVGSTRLTDFGCNIGIVATHEQYRNMGYTTSIVSALLKEILKTSFTALIRVLSDNAPAVHVYSKVGFKPYKTYLFIRGEKNKRIKCEQSHLGVFFQVFFYFVFCVICLYEYGHVFHASSDVA